MAREIAPRARPDPQLSNSQTPFRSGLNSAPARRVVRDEPTPFISRNVTKCNSCVLPGQDQGFSKLNSQTGCFEITVQIHCLWGVVISLPGPVEFRSNHTPGGYSELVVFSGSNYVIGGQVFENRTRESRCAAWHPVCSPKAALPTGFAPPTRPAQARAVPRVTRAYGPNGFRAQQAWRTTES